MPVEHKPDNLDLSDITVLPKEVGWSLPKPDSNRIEIHHWKDEGEAREALANEYVANMQPGTRAFKAHELYARRSQIGTDLAYNPKAYDMRSNYYQEREAEFDAVVQERTQIEKEDPLFGTLYSQARVASDKLHGRFHKAFPTEDAKVAKANAIVLSNAIANKVDEVLNPKSQQPEPSQRSMFSKLRRRGR